MVIQETHQHGGRRDTSLISISYWNAGALAMKELIPHKKPQGSQFRPRQ